jgi:hypothetical protein
VGSGTPRQPRPPSQRQADKAKVVIDIRGLRDHPSDQAPFVRGLRNTGGVKDAWVDEATGKYVVVFDPRRMTRDDVRVRILEIGRELGREVHPIFDDR